jgi:uncharacterized protein (DUF362 family)
MGRHTRREFLKQAAVVSGALALGPRLAWSEAPSAPEGTGAATPEAMDLAIARWGSGEGAGVDLADAAARLTERAVAGLGGMRRFVSRQDVVWIKPNLAWNRVPELAATTHPEVVAALVRLCLDAGAKQVKVGDHTCHDAKQTYVTSGIAAAARREGAQIVYLDDRRFRDVEIGGQRILTWPLYPEIIEADLVINVPVVKHHGLSKVTLCMKNYMGVIGGQINTWHQDLPNCLVDITRFMKPRLCVLDAVRMLTGHGPQGGNPADVATPLTVAAGTDIVALDAWGAELLGHRPADIRTVRAGFEAGLGQMDYRQLAVTELMVS